MSGHVRREHALRLLCLGLFSATVLASCPADLSSSLISLSPPLTPTDLTVAVATPTSLDISWDVSTGAQGYQVYRSTDPDIALAVLAYSGPEHDSAGSLSKSNQPTLGHSGGSKTFIAASIEAAVFD